MGAISACLNFFIAMLLDGIITLSPNIHIQILQTDLYTFP